VPPTLVGVSEEQSHWARWHGDYEIEGSALSRRLAVVQEAIRDALPAQLTEPYHCLSMCAGQGRDLIEVLAGRQDADQARALLVESDPGLAADARRRAGEAALSGVEVVEGDAARLSAYEQFAPADLVLAVGVFGNISDADIFRTIAHLPQLCRPAARVVWTRGRWEPDLTPAIRESFAEHDFHEVDFVAPDDATFSVGVAEYVGEPVPLDRAVHLFTFR